jgi:hypothetical protein
MIYQGPNRTARRPIDIRLRSKIFNFRHVSWGYGALCTMYMYLILGTHDGMADKTKSYRFGHLIRQCRSVLLVRLRTRYKGSKDRVVVIAAQDSDSEGDLRYLGLNVD